MLNPKGRLVFIVFLFFATALNSQTINTVAGNGTSGFSGDGWLAVFAKLYTPNGIALDDSGNMYIGDNLNNRIRKVYAQTGVIITVAGNGTGGYSGDGKLATEAELNKPGNIAVDRKGNIYIADVFNQRIRKVIKSTGIIITIAGTGKQGYTGDGGPATAASFSCPGSVKLDASGNIYIADALNNVIRKINVQTGIIRTVAGNGTSGYKGDKGPAIAAEINAPTDLAFDAGGNMYISDGSNVIRKVNARTGIITTVVGNGAEAYGGDGGPAMSASIDGPVGIAIDKSGNMYIADIDNNRIREVNAAGIVTTLAGNGMQGFAGDRGPSQAANIYAPLYMALDKTGDLYFADSFNNRIRKISR